MTWFRLHSHTFNSFYKGVYINDFRGDRTEEELAVWASYLHGYVVTWGEILMALSVNFLLISTYNHSRSYHWNWMCSYYTLVKIRWYLYVGTLYFIDPCPIRLQPANIYILAKKIYPAAKLFRSIDTALVGKFKIPGDKPALFAVKRGVVEKYPGEDFNDIDALTSWAHIHQYPLLVQLNEKNAADIFSRNAFTILGFFDSTDESSGLQKRAYLTMAIHYLDQKGRDPKDLFAWLDVHTWDRYAFSAFGVSKSDIPAVVIVSPNGQEFYDYGANGKRIRLDEQSIFEAMDNCKAGKLAAKHIQGSFATMMNVGKSEHVNFSSSDSLFRMDCLESR